MKSYKGFSGNAIRSGWNAKKPVSEAFQALYDAKVEEYKKHTANEPLIHRAALAFVQLQQGESYSNKTGKLPAPAVRVRGKKKLLERLERKIKGTPEPKIKPQGTPQQSEPQDNEGKEEQDRETQRRLSQLSPEWRAWVTGEDEYDYY